VCVSMGFCRVFFFRTVQCFNGFLPSFTEFFSGQNWVSTGFTEFYRFYRAIQCFNEFTEFYLVLPSFIEFF